MSHVYNARDVAVEILDRILLTALISVTKQLARVDIRGSLMNAGGNNVSFFCRM